MLNGCSLCILKFVLNVKLSGGLTGLGSPLLPLSGVLAQVLEGTSELTEDQFLPAFPETEA